MCLIVFFAFNAMSCTDDVDESSGTKDGERSEVTDEIESSAAPLTDDDIADVEVDERLFAPAATDSLAADVRTAVDAAFDDDLEALATDSTSSMVLAERRRTCSPDGSDCQEWELDRPLQDTTYDTNGVFAEIDWDLIFERASARSIGRILGRNVSNAGGEEQTDEGYEVVQQFQVSASPMDETIEDAREDSYAAANDRSWPQAEKRLEELQEEGKDKVGVALMFDSKFHGVSRHHINWFDVQPDDEIGKQIRAKQAQGLEALHDTYEGKFTDLNICQWGNTASSANAATAKCSLDELEQLLADPPDFIEGIDIDRDSIPGAGDNFRSEPKSRLGNYLDVTSNDARTGLESSPSGSSRVTAAYADVGGFFEVNEHPAFKHQVCLPGSSCYLLDRVHAMKSCNSQQCFDDWDQGDPDYNHGGEVIGAFQSILDGQDSNITDPNEREERSYGAYDAWLRLYEASTISETGRAVENASEVTGEG